MFLIFWIENVVLGLWTIPKIISARGDGGRMAWFGAGHRRDQVTPAQAMREPYPRIIVLQLATIACFGLFVAGRGSWVDTLDRVRDVLSPLRRVVSVDLASDAVFAVLVLTVVTTAVEVWLTVKALRRRA